MDERSYDVVVVGSGFAGLAATLEASAAGASVLLVEGQAAIGGSSALSGGIVMGAGTSVQKSAGIDDSAAALYRDYLLFSQHSVRPALARRLAEGSAPAIEWLVSHGVEFLDEFRKALPSAQTVVFVMTAFDDASIRRLGPIKVEAIIKKPFDVPRLVEMVREVVRTRQCASANSNRPSGSAERAARMRRSP